MCGMQVCKPSQALLGTWAAATAPSLSRRAQILPWGSVFLQEREKEEGRKSAATQNASNPLLDEMMNGLKTAIPQQPPMQCLFMYITPEGNPHT